MKIIPKIKNQDPENILNISQDHIDLLSYSGLEESSNHLIIDDVYLRTLFISGYPYIASSGWLNSLVNFNHNLDISYQINVVEGVLALPKLQRKITELESTRRSLLKSGRIIGPDVTDPLESAMKLRDKIVRGQEKLFQLSIYVTIHADNLTALNKNTKLLETLLSSHMFYSKIARYQQLEALDSVLPKGLDVLSQKRNLDSSSISLTFPFISSELVNETGILYGVNKSNNSLVILDRFSLNNANSITFAQSGSGKSYACKVEILRQLMQGVNVIVIDPEREYKKLSDSVNGSYIKISTKSQQKINPFDLKTTTHKNNELSEHIQNLIEIISLMCDGLDYSEKAAIDKSIIEIYRKHKSRSPKLIDLYKQLIIRKQIKLVQRLDKYISGSLKDVFNSDTNIDLDNNLIVFDIKDLPENLRKIMILIISNFVDYKVKLNPVKRLLIIDEGWILMQQEESARFISGLVRRARKYYLGVSIISQQANDFLNNDYGRAIASQSSLRILMKQDTTTIQNVVNQFHLSEFEENFLLTCDKGESLIIADQNHVAVKVVASEKEHPLITTNPKELYDL